MTNAELLKKLEEREESHEGTYLLLDELVHDAHSKMASRVNNEGPEGQVDWLLGNGFTPEQILKEVSGDGQG